MEIDGILPVKLSEISTNEVPYGPRNWPLIDLLDAWAGRVLRLYEYEADQEQGSWTVHDYIGALYLRDAIHAGLARLGTPQFAILLVVDEMFRHKTTDQSRNILQRADPDIPSSEWWWRRIPVSGSVADELRIIERNLR